MKQGVGYTVTLNIVIIFIVIVFVFISGVLIYYKSNKVNNVITDSIEKYEGFNHLAIEEIDWKMTSIGYNKGNITCATSVKTKNKNNKDTCPLASNGNQGKNGYCVYYCTNGDYYYYKIRTNMIVNIPILNNVLNVPIYTNTVNMYDFEKNLRS